MEAQGNHQAPWVICEDVSGIAGAIRPALSALMGGACLELGEWYCSIEKGNSGNSLHALHRGTATHGLARKMRHAYHLTPIIMTKLQPWSISNHSKLTVAARCPSDCVL